MTDNAEPFTELAPRGWTPERKMLFLDRLAVSGNARAACRRVGLSAESAYRQRRKDPLFARGWAAAVLLGRDASQQVLADRAVDGIEEDVWHRGEVVGTRRRYDTRLLLAHLARLDNLASEEAAGDAAIFEELLTRIGSGDTAEGPTERQRYIQRETDRAVDEARRAQLTVELEEDNDHPCERIPCPNGISIAFSARMPKLCGPIWKRPSRKRTKRPAAMPRNAGTGWSGTATPRSIRHARSARQSHPRPCPMP